VRTAGLVLIASGATLIYCMSQQRHEGPWPYDCSPMACDRCGALVRYEDHWHAWTDPYGPFGWTFICGRCDDARKTAKEEEHVTTPAHAPS
jgi:hypothetical protein